MDEANDTNQTNNLVLGKIKVYDDKETLRRTLKKAKTNNWSRCPRCGQIIEREVNLSIFKQINQKQKNKKLIQKIGWVFSYYM